MKNYKGFQSIFEFMLHEMCSLQYSTIFFLLLLIITYSLSLCISLSLSLFQITQENKNEMGMNREKRERKHEYCYTYIYIDTNRIHIEKCENDLCCLTNGWINFCVTQSLSTAYLCIRIFQQATPRGNSFFIVSLQQLVALINVTQHKHS